MGRMIGFIVVAIVALVAYYFFVARDSDGEQIACTMEALLCPDGSYVGRGGPRCAFTPCPAMTFVVGTLEQNAQGFRLVMDSPSGSGGQGVAYVMPVEIQAADALAELIGKKVKVFGAFREGATLVAERIEGLLGEEGDPTIGEAGVGETVYVNGVRITLRSVKNDSRCPIDVQCVWAGNTTVTVTLKSDTDNETRDIVSDQPPVGFDSFLISIAEVSPPSVSTRTISPNEYVVKFRVTARGAH